MRGKDLATVVLAIGMLTEMAGCANNQVHTALAAPPASLSSPRTANLLSPVNSPASPNASVPNVSILGINDQPVPNPSARFPRFVSVTPGATDIVGKPNYSNLGGPPQLPGGPSGIP
jgi:hypothetical protein